MTTDNDVPNTTIDELILKYRETGSQYDKDRIAYLIEKIMERLEKKGHVSALMKDYVVESVQASGRGSEDEPALIEEYYSLIDQGFSKNQAFKDLSEKYRTGADNLRRVVSGYQKGLQ